MAKGFNWDEFPDESLDSMAAPKASAGFNWDEFETDKPQVAKLESASKGFFSGASLGFDDELAGALEAGGQAIGVKGLGGDFSDMSFTSPDFDFGENYREARDRRRERKQEAQDANPGAYGASEIGGSLATALVPGTQAVKGAGLLKLMGQSAGTGAVVGLGTSSADLTQGEYGKSAMDVGKGAALGGALAAGAYGAGKGLEKIINSETARRLAGKLGDKLDDVSELQAARALGAERGTIKSLGKEQVRKIGRYALDEGIVSPLASTDDLIARNESAMGRGAKMMNDVYQAVDDAGASNFNPLNVASKIDDELGGFWRSPINKGEAKQLENTLESVLMRGDRNIPIREAQVLKEELGKVANWKNNLQITDKEQMARDAYKIVSQAIDEAADAGSEAIGVGGLKNLLQAGKQLYSRGKGAEKLLENKFAREQGNRLFGLTDAITGAGSLGYGGATGDWGTATAILGAKKGFDKYGAQTMAVGLNKIGDIVKRYPNALGKFTEVLKQAEMRGPQGLASTHFILQQTNPEYRKMLMKVSDNDEGQENGF